MKEECYLDDEYGPIISDGWYDLIDDGWTDR